MSKYANYLDIFLFDLSMELLKNTTMNKYANKLGKSKQLPYAFTGSFSSVELEVLKPYIKIYVKTIFIQPLKSVVRASILFDEKSDDSFHLCVNSWSFNNLIIKNRYFLSLICEFFNQLAYFKRFTQLDLTNTYY